MSELPRYQQMIEIRDNRTRLVYFERLRYSVSECLIKSSGNNTKVRAAKF